MAVNNINVAANLLENGHRVVTAATVASATSGTTPSASVSVSGGTASFSFVLPKGDTGATGQQGPQGEQGIQGIQGIQGPAGVANVKVQTTQPSAEALWFNTGTRISES